VIPGRYAGEAIPIHDGPTPELIAAAEQRMYADGLAGRISAAAAEAARCQSVLLELLGEFDAIGAIRFWNDFKSLAHWLSWSCAMTPGVAREHVRVAKALRRMPTIAGLFREIDRLYNRLVEGCDISPGIGVHQVASAAFAAFSTSGEVSRRQFCSLSLLKLNQSSPVTLVRPKYANRSVVHCALSPRLSPEPVS
jgi:hypothetical protein